MISHHFRFHYLLFFNTAWILVLPASPALAISIQFNYSYDTCGFFTDNQAARNALEHAAGMFEPFLDTLAAIQPGGGNRWSARFSSPGNGDAVSVDNLLVPWNTLVIFAGGRNLSGTAIGVGGPGGYSADGDQCFLDTIAGRGEGNGTTAAVRGLSAYDFGPWGGSISFDTTRFDGEPQKWHYGINSLPASNQIDFLSVAIHELAHVLGFGVSDSFDHLISCHEFTGNKAVGIYDDQVPMATDDSHWADGTISPGEGETAMDPGLSLGTRKLFTALDYAAMNDFGWQVPICFLESPTILPGDFNQDGAVDRIDLSLWQNEFGTHSATSSDTNEDGYVDGTDFLIWQGNFGISLNSKGWGSGAAILNQTVPEPSSLLLAALVMSLFTMPFAPGLPVKTIHS